MSYCTNNQYRADVLRITGRLGLRRLAVSVFHVYMLKVSIVVMLAVNPTFGTLIIEDFESHGLGSFSSSEWVVVDPVTSGSPAVQSNANNISGQHLQFVSTYSPDAFDSIATVLPHKLTSDGDYIQVATNVLAGTAMASMFLQPGPFLGGAVEPWASVGLDTQFNQFNHGYNTVHVPSNRFGSASNNTWYYLRATMRDAGGDAGTIDSYDFQVFGDAAGTNLLNQKLGIGFRNGYEGPISHVALRVFEQNDQLAAVLYDQLSTNKTSSDPEPVRPLNYGTQWVRENPFNIFARGADDANELLIQQLGLTSVEIRQGFRAQVAFNQGMTWSANPSEALYATEAPQLTDELKAQIADFVVQGGYKGVLQLDDEPAIEVMPELGDIADWVKDTYPQLMIFTTAGYGPTPQYIDALMTTVRPDVLMYDIYPALHGQAMDLNYHFENLVLVRSKGQQYNVPVYAWLQSLEDFARRMPSDSELRLLTYSYLASGYKGLGYYRYRSNATSGQIGLLDYAGQPVPLYADAAELNQEVQRLGEVLKYLESTDIRFIPGQRLVLGTTPTDNPAPTGLTEWSMGAGSNNLLLSVDVQNGDYGSTKNGMIGFFTDDSGGQYFMLTNLFHNINLSAEATTLTLEVTFDSSVESVWLLNRLTGLVEEIELTNHVLTWTLPGGTGDLFKLGNGIFAGMILSGDLNGDGFVGIGDLNLVLGAWNQSVSPGVWLAGDPSGDGFVGIEDLNLVLSNWNIGVPPGTESGGIVPEPGSAAVLIAFLVCRCGNARHDYVRVDLCARQTPDACI